MLHAVSRRACALVGAIGTSACGRLDFDEAALHDASPADSTADSTPDAAAPQLLYASSPNVLYRIDPASLAATAVVNICGPNGTFPTIADIAIDHAGDVFAADQESPTLFAVDMTTGACVDVALAGTAPMFGLEFVPAGVLGPTEVLLGVDSTDVVYKIDPMLGSTQMIGPLGIPISGDIAWTGTELLVTTSGSLTDHLARVDLDTGAATDLGDTGYSGVRGLAWANGTLYGFAFAGPELTLDPATGSVTRSVAGSEAWGGGASTR